MNTITATITREWLARIISGKKRYEWRGTSDFWEARLKKVGSPPFHFRLINGMKKNAPEATVLVSAVHWDLAEIAFRFTIEGVVELKNWKSEWARLHAEGWIDEPDRTPVPKSRRAPLATIPVSHAHLGRLERREESSLEIPSYGDLYDLLAELADPPFVVRLHSPRKTADVVVRNMLTPYASDGPTVLVIDGPLDAARSNR